MPNMEYLHTFLKEEDISKLIRNVDHQDLFTRCSAINHLELLEMEPEIEKAIPVLLEVLLSYNDLSSMMASMALGRLGSLALPSVLKRTLQIAKNWLAVLSSGQPIAENETRLSKLFRVLGHIGNAQCLPELLPIIMVLVGYHNIGLIDPELYRLTMIDALTCIGKTRSEKGVTDLIYAARQLPEHFQSTIIWSLGQIGGEKARKYMQDLLSSQNNPVYYKTVEMLSQDLTIFLSSTFRDMQSDRDALVNDCLPRLRKMCQERGVNLSVVDLRWGITPEDTTTSENLVRACLQRINQCQSQHFIFVGLLGYQYGYTCQWERTGEMHSMTEIEILHALTNDNSDRPHLSLFYLREPQPDEDTASETAQQAQALRHRVADLSQKYPDVKVMDSYDSPHELSQLLYDDVSLYIEQKFPQFVNKDDLFEPVLEQHRWYISQLTPTYIPQAEDFSFIDSAVHEIPHTPILVTGPEGVGKTALMCHWAAHHRSVSSADIVITHNLKLSNPDQKGMDIVRHVAWELARVMGRPGGQELQDLIEEASTRPAPLQELLRLFAQSIPDGRKVVLLLDGFGRGDLNLIDTSWDYPLLSEKVSLLAFCEGDVRGLESNIRSMQNQNVIFWHEMKLERDLNELDVEGIVIRALNEVGKELTFQQQLALLSLPMVRNPLYLREILARLVRFVPKPGTNTDSFEQIVLDEIKRFAAAVDLEELYVFLLKDAIDKYGSFFVELITFVLLKDGPAGDDEIIKHWTEKGMHYDASILSTLHDFLGDPLNYRTTHIAFKQAFSRIQTTQHSNVGHNRATPSQLGNVEFIPHAAETEELIASWNQRARVRVDEFLSKRICLDDYPIKIRIPCQRDGGAQLEKAIRKAKDGTLFLLQPGNYTIHKTITIKDRIALMVDPAEMSARDKAVTIFSKNGLKEVFKIDLGKGSRRSQTEENLPTVLFEGINFQANHSNCTILTADRGFVGLKDCNFVGFHKGEAIPPAGGYGILLLQGSSGYAAQCSFNDFGASAIQIMGDSDFLSYQCQFVENAWGVTANCSGNSGMVLDCTFQRNYWGGIQTLDRAELIVFDNQIHESGGEGLKFGGESTVIAYNNRVSRSLYNNIFIAADARVALVKNQSLDSYSYGICSQSRHTQTTIYRNQVFRNNFGGMRFDGGFHGKVLDNEVAYNYLTGITLSQNSCALVGYNYVHDNYQNGIAVYSGQSMPIGHNTCSSNGGLGILAAENAIPILARNLCELNGLSGLYIKEVDTCKLEQNISWANKEFGIQIPHGRKLHQMNLCCRNAIANIGSIDYTRMGSR